MTTFIRVAEIWVPDAEGHLLEFGGGLYGHAPEFGAVSRTMCFGRGEGLPGRVWEEGVPIVLADLQAGSFQRAAAAKAAQLRCAVAFPMFFQQHLKAVVVLFCGDVAGQSGAIEIWRNGSETDGSGGGDMHWHDGLYGTKDATFAAASRQTVFARGVGLVGMAWQQKASVFMDGLSASTAFVRAREAGTTELTRGLAIPCPVPVHGDFVLTFLSAPAMPIAQRIESWVPGEDGQSLRCAYGFSEASGAEAGMGVPGMAGNTADVPPDAVDPTVFAAFASAVPKVRADAQGSLIALPVVNDAAVVETVAMTF